jgi:hypothetical protein
VMSERCRTLKKKKGRLASATLRAPATVPHLEGDCWTSAPGAYVPAASRSGTTANRRAARATAEPT